MSTTYLVENNNPVISPARPDGKQEIGVHDRKTGNRRYIITDKAKIDEFVNTRSNKMKKTDILGALGACVVTGLSALGATSIAKHKNADMSKGCAAAMGSVVGLMISSVAVELIREKVDKDLTQSFIDANA